MEPHGSDENGLNWADGHIPYYQVKTVLSEAAAPFDHLYLGAMTNVNFSMVFSIDQYTFMKTSSGQIP